MKQMENLLNSLLIFVTALLSFWDFFSSVAFFLICLDLNKLSFFYSPSSLFIANSNGANVVGHSPDPL